MEEASGPDVLVFPDNWQTVEIYLAMSTQWRVGMGGAVGLDYGPLLTKGGVLDLCGVRRKHRADVFNGVQIMESAALTHMNAKA